MAFERERFSLIDKTFFIGFWRRAFFAVLAGLLAGAAAALFLFLLGQATWFRQEQPILIWLLPVAGLLVGWIYYRFGRDVAAGNNLILEEIHDPKNIIPLRMAPLVLFGTIVTHLFGGSAGREGTVVQMGASLADRIGKFFRVSMDERKILLVAGTGAGFGAALGAPWAGVIFGMEVVAIGGFRLFAVVECLLASFTAFFTVMLFGVAHTAYPVMPLPALDGMAIFGVAIAGVVFGLAAKGFSVLTHKIEAFNDRAFRFPPLKPFFAGLVLVGFYHLVGSDRYAGLGLEVIQEGLVWPVGAVDPLWKAIATAMTVGSGFKGGEFIPLVFIGTTLGNLLSAVLPGGLALLAAVGFAAVFAGAANTPIACTLMAIEIFGWPIAPYALIGCFVSYHCSGHRGIYRQKIRVRKHERFVWAARWLRQRFQ